MKSKSRIAFVIDALPALGGGEKVLFTALEAYPNADVFTLVYNRQAFAATPLAGREVRTSFLDSLPFVRRRHRLFLPLMPSAIERLDLRDYELIVSFSYAVAHGARSYNGARHLSYTYTPMRYAWTDINIDGTRTGRNPLLDRYFELFRDWDRRAAARVHEFASISRAVARRIEHAYRRAAPVIYPPVEVGRFHPLAAREEYYITVSRLVAHKRIDLLVRAFSQLELPLLVVGEGPELSHLRKLAGDSVRFLGYQPDERVAELLGRARGFVCAAEEDFGIAVVEAQAAGCPVLAYAAGGALETVREGITGLFFAEQSVAALIAGLQEFERRLSCFHTFDLVQNAHRFSKPRFLREFREFVEHDRVNETSA